MGKSSSLKKAWLLWLPDHSPFSKMVDQLRHIALCDTVCHVFWLYNTEWIWHFMHTVYLNTVYAIQCKINMCIMVLCNSKHTWCLSIFYKIIMQLQKVSIGRQQSLNRPLEVRNEGLQVFCCWSSHV